MAEVKSILMSFGLDGYTADHIIDLKYESEYRENMERLLKQMKKSMQFAMARSYANIVPMSSSCYHMRMKFYET